MEMKRLITCLVICGILLWTSAAHAAYNDADAKVAGNSLVAHGIVTGRTGPDPLALGANVTRAELMTMMVRAFGKEDAAKAMKDARPFPDVVNHWSAGYVAVAKAMMEQNGFAVGLPDGNFNPNGSLTAAESVAFMMKFLGVQPDSSKPWPKSYLEKASAAGLIDSADEAALSSAASVSVTRGMVFYLLDHAFSTFKFDGSKTVYQAFHGEPVPTPTQEAPAPPPTPAPAPVSAGTPAWVDLQVESPSLVVGSSTHVTITVRDAAGNAVPGVAYDVKLSTFDYAEKAPIGSFDRATGTFTAGTVHGTGTLTVTAGSLDPVSATIEIEPGPVTLIVVSPTDTTVPAGIPLDFKAFGLDSYNNSEELTHVRWSVSKGSIQDGHWVATGDPGERIVITASANGLTGTAVITIVK